MQDRARDHKKVTVHFNTAVDDAYPDGKGALAGLHIKDTKTGQPCLSCTPTYEFTQTPLSIVVTFICLGTDLTLCNVQWHGMDFACAWSFEYQIVDNVCCAVLVI